MANASSVLPVSTTAQPVVAAVGAFHAGYSMVLRNIGTSDVLYGGAGLVAAAGTPIKPGEVWAEDVRPGSVPTVVVASGTGQLSVYVSGI